MNDFRAALLSAALILLSTGVFACTREPSTSEPPSVLLFNGSGTSPNDARALESLLHERHLNYATADSKALGEMTDAQLMSYRLLIVPGGNFEDMGNGLSPASAAKVRNAIGAGLNYVGICAGAFIAGNSPYNGMNLTSGVRFGFYAAEAKGIRRASVNITIAGAPPLEQYWEDGPQLTGWGDVVARYQDGTPAIVEGMVGNGFVLLIGTHPEAPNSWRQGLTFTAPATVSRQFAATLIEAALAGKPLRHF